MNSSFLIYILYPYSNPKMLVSTEKYNMNLIILIIISLNVFSHTLFKVYK